jgi:SWI/SNF-related matrix-associated actin-dependent regulator 1 of chromatin subfamily A
MSLTLSELEQQIEALKLQAEKIRAEDEAYAEEETRLAIPQTEWEVGIANGGTHFTLKVLSDAGNLLGTFARNNPTGYYTYGSWQFPMTVGKLFLVYTESNNISVKNLSAFVNSHNDYISTPDIAIGFVEPNFTIKFRTRNDVHRLFPFSLYSLLRENHVTKAWMLPQYNAPDLIKIIEKLKEREELYVLITDGAEAKMAEVIQRLDSLNAIAKLESIPEYQTTFADNRNFFPFQTVSQRFSELTNHRFILADEMGLGKTLQAIGIAHRNKFRTLCIVPANVLPNWHREIEAATGKPAITFRGNAPSQFDIMELVVHKQHQFSIIGWPSLSNTLEVKEENGTTVTLNEWARYINISNFDIIIIDEAHRMKNESSQRSKAMMQLTCPRIVGMTGTPIENRPIEYYNILHLLYPDVFASRADFENRFCDGKNGAKNVAQLQQLLQPVMLRRKKSDVMKDLPPVIPMQDFTEIGPKARKVYNKIANGILEIMDSSGNVANTKQLMVLEMLMKLKQFTSAMKVNRAVELAEETYNGSEGKHKKVLIFSQFRPIARRIASKLGNDAIHFDGTIDVYKRQEIVDRFQNDPSIKYLVCTTKSAQEGLNITAAGTVVFVDLMWTPSAHDQAIARAYGRLSDAHGVDVHYLLCEETFDEDIWDLLAQKLGVINQVVDGVNESRTETGIVSEVLKRMFKRRIK